MKSLREKREPKNEHYISDVQNVTPNVCIQNFQSQYKRRRKFWRVFKIIFFVILVGIIAISAFSHKIISGQNSVLSNIGRLPVIKQFRQIFGMENLKGELDNRINFLLLGQGGVNHEGPYLTDTIILGSIKPSTNEVAMISIPRDFYINMRICFIRIKA